jgi:hypothetical protein
MSGARRFVALFLAFALMAFAAAQDSPKPCSECKDTGRLACPKHPAAECELEDHVLYCSVLADCPVCGGAGFVPCERCRNSAAREELEKRRNRIKVRRAALQAIDDKAGRPLRKAESAHFVFTWEMDKFKIGKRVVSAHEGLHVYTARMEAAFADYVAALGIDAKEFEEKCWIFVWYLPHDQEEGAAKFCDSASQRGVTFLGLKPRYSVCGSKPSFRGDEELHRNIVHQLSHLLLSHQEPMGWLGERKSGWADEGLAHWFEEKVSGLCDTYCHHESDGQLDFEGGRYRLGVRRLVSKDAAPSMLDVMQRNADGLSAEMNALSYSYVDYLLTLDGKKFDTLLRKLKARVPVRDVVQEIYGVNLIDLEAKWKAWVLETYPVK